MFYLILALMIIFGLAHAIVLCRKEKMYKQLIDENTVDQWIQQYSTLPK